MNIFLKSMLLQIVFVISIFADSTPLEKVSLQLVWKHQFEFAGYYMAKEKGFYKDVGIDVNILEYENGIQLAKSVEQKQHTFAIGYSGLVLDAINTNDIVLLNAVFQSSPHVLVTLKSSGIKSIRDFKNKKIMIDPESKQSVAFISMLHSHGVSFDDMTVQEPTFKVESLINSETDVASWYLSNETYMLDKMGIGYDVWDPKNYGFDFYNDLLFTSKKELKESPQIVENFRAASLKGWKYAFSHIDETVDVILRKYNTQNKSEGELLYEANILKNLTYSTDKKLGIIEKEKIQRLLDIYNLLGFYKNSVNVDELIYKVPNKFSLTQKEKEYLRKKKVINMCTDPNWMPFEKLKDGQHIGIAADIFQLIRKTLDIDIKLVKTKNWDESLTLAQQRKCDILSLLMSTPERKKYLNFTDPYLKIPIVMATKTDVPFTNDFHSLKGKKIGIPKGYAFIELLKASHPNLNIVEVQSIDDGLKKVVEGDLYGYIGTLASIGYAFQKKFTGELKISGKFDGTWDLGIGVRNDDKILFNIFQKAVQSIDESTRQKILNNWLAINYIKETDYNLLFKTIGGFTLLLLILMFFYLKQIKLKKQLELLASTDSMTKLYNRRYFEDAAEQFLKLTKRDKTNLSLIMLDIDNFKVVNDTYGHKVGDTVLINLSQTLQDLTRKSDIICRFGGEEFLILLPQTNLEGASNMAQKIRATVEKFSFTSDNLKQLQFTISLGVSQVDILKDKNIEDAIKRADDALYKAKKSGKNKVCLQKDNYGN